MKARPLSNLDPSGQGFRRSFHCPLGYTCTGKSGQERQPRKRKARRSRPVLLGRNASDVKPPTASCLRSIVAVVSRSPGGAVPPPTPPHSAENGGAQSVKRISFSLQTLNASLSLVSPPSKAAATETVQPFIFGSLTAVRPFGASGFESVAGCSPAAMTTPVTPFALAWPLGTPPRPPL